MSRQPKEDAARLAETLLAATLSASAAVEEGDWPTAGQLLDRREQVLAQLESLGDLQAAEATLRAVQSAEESLAKRIEQATQEAIEAMGQARDLRTARKAYRRRAGRGTISSLG